MKIFCICGDAREEHMDEEGECMICPCKNFICKRCNGTGKVVVGDNDNYSEQRCACQLEKISNEE